MAENTTPFNPDQQAIEPPVDHIRTNLFRKAGTLAVRAARAASNAATTRTMALARSVIKAIYRTTGMQPHDYARKQQYINLRDITDHICDMVEHLKIKYIARWIKSNEKEENTNRKRHKVILPQRLEENDIIDLLDDAFAPSYVQCGGEEATVDCTETRRRTHDLLVDLGSRRAGTRR